MLFGNSTADGGAAYNPVTSYAGSQSGSVVNVDGLLGLSHWFDAASKLTLGYRADAHFKNTQNRISVCRRRRTPIASTTDRWSVSRSRSNFAPPSFRGACEAREPGIQSHTKPCAALDSGFALTRAPE